MTVASRHSLKRTFQGSSEKQRAVASKGTHIGRDERWLNVAMMFCRIEVNESIGVERSLPTRPGSGQVLDLALAGYVLVEISETSELQTTDAHKCTSSLKILLTALDVWARLRPNPLGSFSRALLFWDDRNFPGPKISLPKDPTFPNPLTNFKSNRNRNFSYSHNRY